MNKIATEIITAALKEACDLQIPIHTFALYYDHESPAISVCIDTAEQSRQAAIAFNRFNTKHFLQFAIDGDLAQAAKWQANGGRNLELGGFAYINLQRRNIPTKRGGTKFYAGLLQSLVAQQELVARQAKIRSDLILCCTGPNDEVEYVWSVPDEA